MTGDTPAYVAAVIIDPIQKWSYFEEQWNDTNPKWIPEWKAKIEKFWSITYKPVESEYPALYSSQAEPSKNTYVAHLQSKKASKIPKDEYTRYLSLPPVDDVKDSRTWWLEATQQEHYPNLSKMALDMLSIPAMSDDAERVFSSCKLTITDRRNRLSIEVIEQLECLKSWMGLENWCDPPINVDMLLF